MKRNVRHKTHACIGAFTSIGCFSQLSVRYTSRTTIACGTQHFNKKIPESNKHCTHCEHKTCRSMPKEKLSQNDAQSVYASFVLITSLFPFFPFTSGMTQRRFSLDITNIACVMYIMQNIYQCRVLQLLW